MFINQTESDFESRHSNQISTQHIRSIQMATSTFSKACTVNRKLNLSIFALLVLLIGLFSAQAAGAQTPSPRLASTGVARTEIAPAQVGRSIGKPAPTSPDDINRP